MRKFKVGEMVRYIGEDINKEMNSHYHQYFISEGMIIGFNVIVDSEYTYNVRFKAITIPSSEIDYLILQLAENKLAVNE